MTKLYDDKNNTYFFIYDDKKYEYIIIKRKIKNIYIFIKNNKVYVKTPNNLSIREIEKIIKKKELWIVNKVNENLKKMDFLKNKVHILGKEYDLKVKYLCEKEYLEYDSNVIRIYLKNDIGNEEKTVSNIIYDEYINLANKFLPELISYAQSITGFVYSKYKIKKLKNAWGTCTSTKVITINPLLFKFDIETIRYVVIHEFCHLKYMNHSGDFYSLLKKYVPNYKEIRKLMKNN